MLGSKISMRFLPLLLAVYIAMSALRSSSSAVWCARPSARRRPMLARTKQLLAADASNGAWRAASSRSRDLDRGRRGRRVLDQDRELVAAHPRERVAGAQRTAQPLATRDQELVALAVAEAVVDRLEVVEVDEQDRQPVAAPRCAGRARARARSTNSARLARPVSESWNAWWRSSSSSALRGGDVAVVDDDAADRRIVEQVLADDLDPAPRAVGVARSAPRRRLGAGRARRPRRAAAAAHARSSGWTTSSAGLADPAAADSRGPVRRPGSRRRSCRRPR